MSTPQLPELAPDASTEEILAALDATLAEEAALATEVTAEELDLLAAESLRGLRAVCPELLSRVEVADLRPDLYPQDAELLGAPRERPTPDLP